jgi:hypothetical protein
MANRMFEDVMCLGKGVVVIAGSFAPNGSSAVASTSVKGKGFSVVRTSTGLFTVTLEDTYVAALSMVASIQLASGDDKFVQVGAVDVTSAKTIEIRVWDISGGAVADVSANANNRINFCFVLSNSSLNS